MNRIRSLQGRKMRRIALGLLAIGAVMVFVDASARGGRGGGGGAAMRGGGGGRMASSSVSRANYSARPSTGDRSSTRDRPSNYDRPGNYDRADTRDVDRGDRVNTGDINIDNDYDIDIDNGYNNGWGHGHYDGALAAGIVIGAVAVSNAAVMGSYYYALPPNGCSLYYTNSINYYHCGSVYYQQVWSGNDVVYVVVNP